MPDNDQMPEDLFQEALRAETDSQAPPEPQPAPDPTPAAVEPQADATETTVDDEWRTLATSMGYEVGEGETVRDVLTKIHNDRNLAVQRAGEAAQQAQHWYQESESRRAPVQPEPTKTGTPEDELNAYFAEKWNAPQVDQKWFDLVTRDETTGRYVPRTHNGIPIASQEIVQKVNEYTQWFQQKPLEFFENPYRNVYEAIQDPLSRRMEKLVDERLRAMLAEKEATSEIQRYEQENEKHLYQFDSSGKKLTDRQGNVVLTEYGQSLRDAMQEFYGEGITSPEKLLKLATRLVGPPPAQEEAEETEEPAKPSPGTPNGQPAPRSKFLENAIRKASTGGGTDASASTSPGDAVMMTDTELDNMLLAAVKQ